MTPRRRYDALLLDYGGVLTTPLTVSFGAFCVRKGVSPERLKVVFARAYAAADDPRAPHPEADRYAGLVEGIETGRTSLDEFEARLAELLSEGLETPLEPDGLAAELYRELRDDERMLDVARRAHDAGIRTALVSNTWGTAAFDRMDLSMFDQLVFSGREGVRKPEPRIYELTAERLGVPPERCVFVDDIPVNLDGARAVGMAAVLHRDAAITIPKLEELFDLSLS